MDFQSWSGSTSPLPRAPVGLGIYRLNRPKGALWDGWLWSSEFGQLVIFDSARRSSTRPRQTRRPRPRPRPRPRRERKRERRIGPPKVRGEQTWKHVFEFSCSRVPRLPAPEPPVWLRPNGGLWSRHGFPAGFLSIGRSRPPKSVSPMGDSGAG